jgi:hypothetical protein
LAVDMPDYDNYILRYLSFSSFFDLLFLKKILIKFVCKVHQQITVSIAGDLPLNALFNNSKMFMCIVMLFTYGIPLVNGDVYCDIQTYVDFSITIWCDEM